jgi:hypothetical protein
VIQLAQVTTPIELKATVSTLNYCGGGPRLASRIKCWCCLRPPVACCCSMQEPAQAARTTALRPPFVIVASSGRLRSALLQSYGLIIQLADEVPAHSSTLLTNSVEFRRIVRTKLLA